MGTNEIESYVKSRNLKRLSYDGPSSLYQTIHGAVTIDRAMELDDLQKSYFRQLKPRPSSAIQISHDLATRNERCIDEHGCSEFLW